MQQFCCTLCSAQCCSHSLSISTQTVWLVAADHWITVRQHAAAWHASAYGDIQSVGTSIETVNKEHEKANAKISIQSNIPYSSIPKANLQAQEMHTQFKVMHWGNA